MSNAESQKPLERAMLFIDGNNWYHSVDSIGVKGPAELCYASMSKKLILNREWVGTHYYIGALNQQRDPARYANQRMFLSRIEKDDSRVTVHLGRIEMRPQANPSIPSLRQFADNPTVEMSDKARKAMHQVLDYYAEIKVEKEKAVDVMLARDIIVGALDDRYDVAFLLSADGDYTPVVETVIQRVKKKVICASPSPCVALKSVATTYLRLDRAWFQDCYRPFP